MNIPLTEKYRPYIINDLVLDDKLKYLLNNIVKLK